MARATGTHLTVLAAAAAVTMACATSTGRGISGPEGPPPGSRDGSAAASITEASIRGHMEFLASDALNGRGSGTRDEWIAAVYIASQFRAWGLDPMGDDGGFVQRVEILREQVSAPPTLRAGGLAFIHGEQMLVTAFGASGVVSGPLVKDDLASTGGPGVVLLPEGATAGDAPAQATLVMLRAQEQMLGQWEARANRLPSLTRVTGVAQRTRPALLYLTPPAYDAMAALAPGTDIELSIATETASPSYTWNAVGRLSGGDPARANEVVVLSAHLDHTGSREVAIGEDGINNGADDDASGTVAVMELARALAAGERPARSIVFALFGSEERGGFGAGYFVDRPVVPLERIVADLQFEMLGRPDDQVPPRTLWLTGYDRSDLGAQLAAAGARLVADPHPDQNFFMRSDNIRFAVRGVIAHTVSSYGLHEDYHRPSDEIATIDFAHMTDAIRSMADPIRWLANSTFRPAWVPGGCPDPCGP